MPSLPPASGWIECVILYDAAGNQLATVPVSAASLPLPAGAATAAKQDTLLSELQLKADLTETQPVSLASVPSHGVTGPLTDTQLRASPVAVSGTVTASGPLTDTQLRAAAVPVSGPLTDTQLRAVAVPISGTVQPGNTANTTAWKVDNSAVVQPSGGDVAHDAIDSGNPLKVGGRAQTGAPAAVANLDRVDAWFDERGRLVVRQSFKRIPSYIGRAGSFLIPGSAALLQPLASIENAAGSAVLIAIRKLKVSSVQTAANLTRPPNFFLSRATGAPAGGTLHGKVASDTAQSSSASVVIRFGASADGTAAAITGLTAVARVASSFGGQLYTAVGAVQPVPIEMIGSQDVDDHEPLILRAGELVLLTVTAALAADNLATRFFAVDVVWEEFVS